MGYYFFFRTWLRFFQDDICLFQDDICQARWPEVAVKSSTWPGQKKVLGDTCKIVPTCNLVIYFPGYLLAAVSIFFSVLLFLGIRIVVVKFVFRWCQKDNKPGSNKHLKHKRVVSISLYLPEKVWVEMSKTQHFETYENCIFINLARQTWNIWAELLNWVVEVIKSEKHFENLVDKSDSIQLKSTSRQGALPVDLLRQSGWNGSRHDTDQKAKKHKTQKSGFH